MNLTRDRLHTIGWGFALSICVALVLALTFRVNAVKSEVRLADRKIAQLTQEKMFLETELETRASQQQLENFNDVDFGYQPPAAGQYLESERQLASLGRPRSPDAPTPIRVASADSGAVARAMPALAEPLARQFAVATPATPPSRKAHVATEAGKKVAQAAGARE